MEIKDKTEHDPVTDLILMDAYMRWALMAAEEVVGEKGLTIVLRDAGLERFIDNYPPEEVMKPSGDITFGDYAALNAGLFSFFGRAGKSMVLRIGRLSANHAIQQQGELFGIAIAVASRVLPISTQLEVGLKNMQKGFRKLAQSVGQEMHLRTEGRGDKLAYIDETCAVCAGKQSTQPMCWSFTGALQESIRWLTSKEFEIIEVECRAAGAPACVWEINKTPKE
ncbi:MAG: V4R domain-containing protein [Anaerolineae bacterium]